jgi:hypothetical protein
MAGEGRPALGAVPAPEGGKRRLGGDLAADQAKGPGERDLVGVDAGIQSVWCIKERMA